MFLYVILLYEIYYYFNIIFKFVQGNTHSLHEYIILVNFYIFVAIFVLKIFLTLTYL